MNNSLKQEWSDLKEKLGFYLGRLFLYPIIPPEHVYFSLTNRCNLRCQMCDISKSPSEISNELTTAQVKNIVTDIAKMKVKHLIFSGGEPFLREDLLELVEFAIGKGFKMVDIITNGTLLNDAIIQKLINIKLHHITISMDGIGDINDGIRGKGVSKSIEENIDRINYYKSQLKASHPSVGINFTVMDNNIDCIHSVVEFAKAKKCNVVVMQPLLFNNTKMQEKRATKLWPSEANINKLEGVLSQIVKIKQQRGDRFIYTDEKILLAFADYFKGIRPRGNFKCYECIKRIVITCEGKLWSCMGIYGDLREKRLKDCWFSLQAIKMRLGVKKCKNHCLQDCIYFPSDPLRDIGIFIKNLFKPASN